MNIITSGSILQKNVFCKSKHTIKSLAVDLSTIQFWTFLSKVQTTYTFNFPFINSLKILWCATNQGNLLLRTLRYVDQQSPKRFSMLFFSNINFITYLQKILHNQIQSWWNCRCQGSKWHPIFELDWSKPWNVKFYYYWPPIVLPLAMPINQ